METTTQIPTDGPDAILVRLAALFQLEHSEQQIRHTIASHPRPTSLLALVDVGNQFGLEMTPAKGNEAALEQQDLPVVAHFNSNDGKDGGFGIIEEISDDSVQVWDSAGGHRTVDRSSLLDQWTGILVPVAVADRETPSRHRLLARITERTEAPHLASSLLLRTALATLMLLALELSISSYLPSDRLLLLALSFLAMFGAGICSVMTIAIADYSGPFAPGLCRRGGLMDCESVLNSRFAKVFGFALSDLGIAFYSGIVLTLIVGHGRPEAAAVVALSMFATIPIAAVLIGVQISMRRFCPLCLSIHGINLLGAVLAVAALPADVGAADFIFMILLFVLLSSFVLLLVIPYLKERKTFERLASTHGRMFASPFASLAQLVTEEPTGLVGGLYGIPIGGSPKGDELVAFVHPSCGQCEPVLREASSLAAAGRVNAFISIPPRDPSERPLCRAIVAIALSHGPEVMARAYRVAKNRFAELVALDDPVPALLDDLDVGVAPAAITEVMEEADALVDRAEAFAVDHVEGTPSVFLNSFPYRGPMAHLVPLLTEHAQDIPRGTPTEVTL